ncbi:hypothetical protein KW823_25915, partial [Enterobacter quasiroggenkampii]|nr:hypothetical protein [Enterobacter quasiroggenkampii]
YVTAMGSIPVQVKEYNSRNQSYSLQMIVNEWHDDCYQLHFDYKITEYNEEEILQMYAHMNHMLARILRDPNALVEHIHLYSEEEFYEKIYRSNTTMSDYPREKTIQQLFEEIVDKHPERVALRLDKE